MMKYIMFGGYVRKTVEPNIEYRISSWIGKHWILILSICFRDNASILFVKKSSAIWKGRLESFNRMKISIYVTVTLNKKYSSYFSYSSYVKMNNEVRNNTYFIRERDVDNDFNEYSVMERYLNVLSSA